MLNYKLKCTNFEPTNYITTPPPSLVCQQQLQGPIFALGDELILKPPKNNHNNTIPGPIPKNWLTLSKIDCSCGRKV